MRNLLFKFQKQYKNKGVASSFLKLTMSSYSAAIIGLIFSTIYINRLGADEYGSYVLYISYSALLSLLGSMGLGVNFIAQIKNQTLRYSELLLFFISSSLVTSLIAFMSIYFLGLSDLYYLIACLVVMNIILSLANAIRLSQRLEHGTIAKFTIYTNASVALSGIVAVYYDIAPVMMFLLKTVIELIFSLYLFQRGNRRSLQHIIKNLPEYLKYSYHRTRRLIVEDKVYYMSLNSLMLKSFDTIIPILLEKFGSAALLAYFNLAQKIISQFLVLFTHLQNLLVSYYDKENMLSKFESYKTKLFVVSGGLFIVVIVAQFAYFALFISKISEEYFYLSLLLFSMSVLTYPYKNVITSLLISHGMYDIYLRNNIVTTFINITLFVIVIQLDILTLFTVSIIFVILQILSLILLNDSYNKYLKVAT